MSASDTVKTFPPITTGRPLLIGRIDAARLCGTSTRTWDRLVSSGRTPRPVRLGARPVWRAAELAAWIDAGCPDQRAWEAMAATKK